MAGGKRGGQGGRGAKPGSHRKGAQQGSGGKGRKALRGKGPTPPAEQRYGHPAARRAGRGTTKTGATKRAPGSDASSGATPKGAEVVAGRNPVVEALREGVPAAALYVADRGDRDNRITQAVRIASDSGVPLQETSRENLDRLVRGASHQGIALRVLPYDYAHPEDLLARARDTGQAPLLVALDGVTDPHNLGAIVRSTAALGGHGVVIPERRAAGVTVGAWKASAGALARLPVARAPNLGRTIAGYQSEGLFAAGLTASGDVPLSGLELAADPLVLVVGSERKGLSRLVEQTCDLRVSVPMATEAESLNASVAAAVALYEVARRRSH